MMDDLQTKVARALCKWQGFKWDAKDFRETPSGEEPSEMREHYKDMAQAAITAVMDEVERELRAVQYSPAPYTDMKHRLEKMRGGK